MMILKTPKRITEEEMAANWERTFGKADQTTVERFDDSLLPYKTRVNDGWYKAWAKANRNAVDPVLKIDDLPKPVMMGVGVPRKRRTVKRYNGGFSDNTK